MVKKIVIRILLLVPMALYGLVVRLRNRLFAIGILPSRRFEIPVISVGNITVGGTGKTPHTEYLLRRLAPLFNIAVLSRGYKRRSKGFVLADTQSTAQDIGDEPFQIHQKFPDVKVAVDKKRVEGIEQLLAIDNELQVVVLDDAFQHRAVRPLYSLLLVDYNRPIWDDCLLPAGRLREPKLGIRRANAVIVTKCPSVLTEDDIFKWRFALGLKSRQRLFFSTFDYLAPEQIWPQNNTTATLSSESTVLVLTGVVSAEGLYAHLATQVKAVEPMPFADHYQFSTADWTTVEERFALLPEPRAIVVTEKDKARILSDAAIPEGIKSSFFSVGIEVRFLFDEGAFFDKLIEQQCRIYLDRMAQQSSKRHQ